MALTRRYQADFLRDAPATGAVPQRLLRLDCQFERDTVKRASYFDLLPSKHQLRRQPEFEAVAAAAHAGPLEVFAIAVGQNLADQAGRRR